LIEGNLKGNHFFYVQQTAGLLNIKKVKPLEFQTDI